MHMSISEGNSTGKNRTPGKSYIYRMNSSFSKDASNIKETTVGPISESNLPTISQNSTSQSSKSNNLSFKSKKGEKPEPPVIKGKINAKETIAKSRGLVMKKESSSSSKRKNNEEQQLRQTGALKFLPKLCIDVPFSAEIIRFNKVYFEKETRWFSRIFGIAEYQRKEQIRSLDNSKIFKVVYDNVDRSPYYDSSTSYWDEKRLILNKDN